ncbi:MAG TPA: glycosyltransferase family 39 protein, partial [Myxococcales bacterium]|nr:glycosyltransferase family 39 protein [Myxococcales bacterium]
MSGWWSTQASEGKSPAALAAVVAIGAAALAAPWFGHFDDGDAQLYLVLARHMAAARAWLDPQYLRHVYPHFREHLPFGVWPFAAAELIAGDAGARAVAALCAMGTLLLVAWLGRRLFGDWQAAAAVLVLGLTESFFRYGAQTRLDTLLILLANVAAVPALLGSRKAAHWMAGAAVAAMAVLVKGPFGLLPFVAAGLARAIDDRRALSWTAAGSLAAAAPLAAFLAADRLWLHQGWWDGYLRGQILASASGARPDGTPGVLSPLRFVAGRFWPGLPLAALGSFAAVRRKESHLQCKVVAVFCGLMLLALCLPARKVWNHTLVAYPGLALLAGAGLQPLRGWLERRSSRAAATLAGAAALAWAGAPLLGRAMTRGCAVPPEF